MFGSNSKSAVKQVNQIDSLVGGNSKIRGDVHFSGGLHVDGEVKGNVVAEMDGSTLTTSEKGRIEGDVRVHNIILNGNVIGDVYSTNHIELAPNARVTGDVYYSVIEMAMGAEVNGNLIHMNEEDEESLQQKIA
ncbi:MAG: polymer-forming cytoskeletal protein [Thiohalomonadales bacterium]